MFGDERVGRDGTRDSRRSRGVLGLQPTIRRVREIQGSQRRTRRHPRADGDQMERFFELLDASESGVNTSSRLCCKSVVEANLSVFVLFVHRFSFCVPRHRVFFDSPRWSFAAFCAFWSSFIATRGKVILHLPVCGNALEQSSIFFPSASLTADFSCSEANGAFKRTLAQSLTVLPRFCVPGVSLMRYL